MESKQSFTLEQILEALENEEVVFFQAKPSDYDELPLDGIGSYIRIFVGPRTAIATVGEYFELVALLAKEISFFFFRPPFRSEEEWAAAYITCMTESKEELQDVAGPTKQAVRIFIFPSAEIAEECFDGDVITFQSFG